MASLDRALGTNFASARDQVELITGSADTPIRIRAIHSCGGEGSGQKLPSYEYEGALASIGERTQKLNLGGYNIYMIAQITRP